MRKTPVYVETSVWNFLFAEDAAYRRSAAEILISRDDIYELYISPIVIYEAGKCPGEFGEVLRDTIRKREPINLPAEDAVIELSREYVRREIIPGRFIDAAAHIAYASYYGIGVLASYNFKHIVKVKTKSLVALVNNLLGYTTPQIVSPEELVEYER